MCTQSACIAHLQVKSQKFCFVQCKRFAPLRYSHWAIIGGERERAPHMFIQRKFVWPCVHASIYLCVHLTGWNIMDMHGKRNMWLSYIVFVAHTLHNATWTTNMDRRAREGSEQRSCQLEHDREWASQRRQQQAPGTRASERLRAWARRAWEGSEQRAHRLKGNREQARERRQ